MITISKAVLPLSLPSRAKQAARVAKQSRPSTGRASISPLAKKAGRQLSASAGLTSTLRLAAKAGRCEACAPPKGEAPSQRLLLLNQLPRVSVDDRPRTRFKIRPTTRSQQSACATYLVLALCFVT